MRRHRKPSVTAARFLVSLVVAGSGLFALATIVAPPVTPVAEARTTQTTTYAPTPTTEPVATTIGPGATVEPTSLSPNHCHIRAPMRKRRSQQGRWDVDGGLIVLGVRARRHRTGVS